MSEVHRVLISHLWKNFSLIQVEVGDIESKWAMFKASIVEADTKSFGQKVIGASRGGDPRARWWTPVAREAVKLMIEDFWLGPGVS